MTDNHFILDGMKFSFSSVNAYQTCPRMFELSYLQGKPKVNNAFAEWGSLLHSLLERYFKNEIEFYELSGLYEKEYTDAVRCNFPPNKYCDLGERYYDKGKEFCDGFDGDFEQYDKVAVEERVDILIDGRPFTGVIDLLVRNEDGFLIVDHKSKSKFKSDKERDEYLRQLYLYALYVKERYGEYPRQLIFNMVRSGGKEIVNFEEQALGEAKRWFTGTIDAIYQDTEFKSHPDKFFCDNLCSVRHSCKESGCYDGI